MFAAAVTTAAADGSDVGVAHHSNTVGEKCEWKEFFSVFILIFLHSNSFFFVSSIPIPIYYYYYYLPSYKYFIRLFFVVVVFISCLCGIEFSDLTESKIIITYIMYAYDGLGKRTNPMD